MSVLAELDTSLQALLALKAPGVTKSRISSITALCVENVKSESVLVQKFYTHFKRTPGSHKLGVLYVIDSVTRQWIEKAGSSTGQDLAQSSAPDGTFAAGVQKIANVLPLMMNDAITNSPYDQKDKISKLVDIWERGNTFRASMITDFKEKLDQRKPDPVEPAFPVPHTSQASTIQAFNAFVSSTPPIQPPVSSFATTSLPSLQPSYYFSGSTAPPLQINSPAVATSVAPPPFFNVFAPQNQPNLSADQMASLQSVIPPHIASDPVALQKHLKTLQDLVKMGVPKEHWLTVTGLLEKNEKASTAQTAASIAAITQAVGYSAPRERSVSPQRPAGLQGSSGYRQRSPRASSTPTLLADKISLADAKTPKWLDFDPTLPAGCIRVLSRTLFVGGTTLSEEELRDIFKQFGEVQTCIPNPEKRHAFIKYCYRAGALKAKEEMENITDPYMLSRVRSVRWGVGFGPRDCNDYNTGISTVPISRLTEADRKWVLTAPYGGTGGVELKGGQVMEEPDIEIGAGVSSKAISRRLGEHETGRRTRGGGGGGRNEYGGHGTRREREPHPAQVPQPQYAPPPMSYGVPPPVLPPQRYDPSVHASVPGFGYPYPPPGSGGMGGMPHYG